MFGILFRGSPSQEVGVEGGGGGVVDINLFLHLELLYQNNL